MRFIDSHAHLYLPGYDDDRDEVISRALTDGIVKILLPNINMDSLTPMMEMAANYPDICLPMLGVHPTSIREDYREELDLVFDNLHRNKYVAIGEIGIDLYWDTSYEKEQEEAFLEQCRIAAGENLPVVIHSRESLDSIFKLLDSPSLSGLKGVFHAFSGTVEEADEIIKRGFLIGIGGILTFKNSSLGTTLAHIDMENIILETDSPYLAPVPRRGKRNESSYIKYIAEKLAGIKNTTVEEIAGISTANCIKLFKLDL